MFSILYLLMANTGRYDCTSTRVVVAYERLELATAHRIEAQRFADQLLAQHGDNIPYCVEAQSEFDANLRIFDEYIHYHVVPVPLSTGAGLLHLGQVAMALQDAECRVSGQPAQLLPIADSGSSEFAARLRAALAPQQGS